MCKYRMCPIHIYLFNLPTGYRGDAFRAPDPDPVRHDPRGAAGPRHLRLRGHGHGQDGGVHAASAGAPAVPTQGVGRHACARSRTH